MRMPVTSHFVFIFLIAAISCGIAADFQLDAVQQQAIQNAPYARTLITAYQHRLSVDDNPAVALLEYVYLLHHYAPNFDLTEYENQLLLRLQAPPLDRPLSANTVLLKSSAALSANIKINASNANCWNVSVAASESSELYLVVWQDERNGLDNPDIFGQYYDFSLNPVGNNFRVHTFSGDAAQASPSVASLSNGGFVVAWEDHRSGQSVIYVRSFDRDKNPVGDEFGAASSRHAQLKPAVGADNIGNFVVTWLQADASGYDVYAKRFANDNSAITDEIRVNDGPSAFQWFPKIAIAENSEALIAWEDKRDGNSDIYGQRFHPDGSKRGGNFRVDDDGTNKTQWRPAVTAGKDNFIICWEDYRVHPNGIYAQWFDSSMLKDEKNVRIDDGKFSSMTELPHLSVNKESECVFCWQDSREGVFHLVSRAFIDKAPVEEWVIKGDVEEDEQRFAKVHIRERMMSFFWIDKKATEDWNNAYMTQILWDVVPVELAAFKVDVRGNTVECRWTTLSETNNLGFAVEKSENGQAFKEIAFIAGHGTSVKTEHYSFMEENVDAGDHAYRLKQVDNNGSFVYSAVVTINIVSPYQFSLSQNYPNPFNSNTTISFEIDELENVTIQVYDINSRLVKTVANKEFAAGQHKAVWDGTDLYGKNVVSGVYFYKLTGGRLSKVRKMILAK